MAFIEKESKRLRQFHKPRVFTASARAAMTHILRTRLALDPRGILLPAYIGLSKIEGSGVFDPIRATGIPYAFYRVNERLEPNMEMLESLLRSGRFQLAFLIHYFGCAQIEPARFIRLCHAYDVQVVEDCAHTLTGGLGSTKLGDEGDYAIFSIHKSTATVDGGFFLDHAKGVVDFPLAAGEEISRETLAMYANTDVLAASRRRLSNYRAVTERLAGLSGLTPFFATIPDGAVPLNLPVLVADGKREALYFKLQEKGVLATALYHTLIPEISEESFPSSHFVSRNILNLPTHPDICDSDLGRYCDVLESCVRETF